MSRTYIPTNEDALNMFGQTFAAAIMANYAGYDLSLADANNIQDAAQDFNAALAKATDPSSRSPVSIEAKNSAKASLVAVLRQYCQMIKKNKGVSTQLKTAVGLTPPDTTPTPIPAPTTSPILTVIGATPLQHTLRFSDASTPDTRAKPPGVNGLMLFCAVGTTPPASEEAASFRAIVSRQPYLVNFSRADAGKVAYYYARWYTVKGLLGPWSQVASMTVAA